MSAREDLPPPGPGNGQVCGVTVTATEVVAVPCAMSTWSVTGWLPGWHRLVSGRTDSVAWPPAGTVPDVGDSVAQGAF